MNQQHHEVHHPIALTRSQIRRRLPALRALTRRAAESVEDRLDLLEGFDRDLDLDDIDDHVQAWFGAVRKLGGVPRGLWLVEFPARAGWFGWRDGDDDITLFRPYGAGPEERSLLQ